MLCNGALLIKKDNNKEGGSKKEKTVMLNGCQIEIIDPIHKKDFVFQIVSPDNDILIFFNI